jgi:uncharacterized protein YjiK
MRAIRDPDRQNANRLSHLGASEVVAIDLDKASVVSDPTAQTFLAATANPSTLISVDTNGAIQRTIPLTGCSGAPGAGVSDAERIAAIACARLLGGFGKVLDEIEGALHVCCLKFEAVGNDLFFVVGVSSYPSCDA